MTARNPRGVLASAAALAVTLGVPPVARAGERAEPGMDPATRLWYAHPADSWENALPVGNGRLGAMVFGRTDEEEIQLNEETYWPSPEGPASQPRAAGVGNRPGWAAPRQPL